MLTHYNPTTIAPPASNYSHGVCINNATNWLHISGQTAVMLNGEIASGIESQLTVCFSNILSVLSDANMTKENLLKLTIYLINPNDTAIYRTVRDRILEETKTASTLVIVSGLAHPDWQVEIEAIAAN